MAMCSQFKGSIIIILHGKKHCIEHRFPSIVTDRGIGCRVLLSAAASTNKSHQVR